MTFAVRQDAIDIQNEMPWQARQRPETVYEMLRATARAHPERPAISFQLTSGARDPAKTLTWAQFHAEVCRAANLFRSLRVGERDAVALVLPNCLEAATATLGAMTAGIVAPINPLLEPEQIAALLRETGARVVVTLKAFPKTDIAAKTAEAVRHAPNVHTVLEVDFKRYLNPPKSWLIPFLRPREAAGAHRADVRDYTREVARQPETLGFDDGGRDRVAAYFHTGGTTGMPKMAQHRYSGMVYNGWLGDRLLFDHTNVLMCPLPLFHVFACHVVLMSALKSGAHVILPTPAGYRGEGVVANFWKLCERWGVTFVITVPTAVAALMQRKVDADISCVKNAFSGSAPMPLELFKRFESATGMTVIEGYGLTEVTCLVSCNPPEGVKKVGSVGVPLPHTDVRIYRTTEDGAVQCAPDEVGEICVDNPGVYHGNTYTDPARNRDLFHGNYLRTGDLGRIDPDGYLWITGRAKDLIIRGGHNIDPAEIEEALMAHPAVAGAGAIGQPDARAGELPCAYVELVEGAEVTPEDLLEHCRQRVRERAAVPKYIEILDELPKTAVGKVFKPDLRKRAITRIYDAALDRNGAAARVTKVVDDKKRGLVALLERQGEADEARVARILGEFTRPWDWADTAPATQKDRDT